MDTNLTLIARAAPGRLVGIAHDGTLRLVWDDAAHRIAAYDLPHLAALLDDWRYDEARPGLRRGYYRIERAPDGGAQLWLNNSGLCLSRDDLTTLTALVECAEERLAEPVQPSTVQPSPLQPFGPGYRRLAAPRSPVPWTN